jgi:Fic family protein
MDDNTKPKSRSEGEIAGYRNVLNLIHSSALEIRLTPSVIRQFHRDLMKYTIEPGGNWKVTQNSVIEYGANGSRRTVFHPVEPYLVEAYITELNDKFTDIISKSLYEPLIIIPMYLLDFLCIHPFPDGNSRVARLISSLLLYRQGYEVGRYISLEKVIEKTKLSYYETLENSSKD